MRLSRRRWCVDEATAVGVAITTAAVAARRVGDTMWFDLEPLAETKKKRLKLGKKEGKI